MAQAVIDAACWAVALIGAALLRLGGDVRSLGGLLLLLPLVCLAQYGAGNAFGLYRGRLVFGSLDEVAALVKSVGAACIALLIFDVAAPGTRPAPLSAVLVGGGMAFLAMGGMRYVWRLREDGRRRPEPQQATRVVVFGAGEGGRRAIQAMLRDRDSAYVPVAMLDDDPRLLRLTFMGLRVVGGREAIEETAREYDASALLLAVPSATGSVLRDLTELATKAGLDVRVLPSIRELLDRDFTVVDIREPTEDDLLGRHRVQTDVEAVAGYVRGRRVLVTGAGGSIGSELCRQLVEFEPAELIMVDRDESALHAVQLALEGRALLDTPNLVLLDIRDRHRVARLFAERRPDVVFHAAALKHLPLLEAHPVEALKSNVWGTLSVLEAAAKAGVGTFVNISTDKAANPCSVLGYSKRIGEGLTAWMDLVADGRYLSVRFGNVLGSRGSVLTSFRKQLETGVPLTVTHPEVTRFFMTVQEAVELVIQAGAIGGGGEAFVLDMGEPVRIADVAMRLAQTVSPPREVEYVGLRAGEKEHEELFGDGERPRTSAHPMISAVRVPTVAPDLVRDVDPLEPPSEIVALLRELCLDMRLDLMSVPIAALIDRLDDDPRDSMTTI